MIIASLGIILWQFQIVLIFSILNAKALATMLPLFSIVCAFATRLLPIVCSKRVASACRFWKVLVKSRNLIQNLLSVKYASISIWLATSNSFCTKFSNFRFNLDFMIIASLEIILWQFQIVLKFLILNAKALAMMLPLFSIVCAFATRLLAIVCSKRVASACRFWKVLVKSRNLIQNLLSVKYA